LKTVEEVVADDDDRGAAGCPTFTRTDGFDGRRRCTQEAYTTTTHSCRPLLTTTTTAAAATTAQQELR